MEIILASGSPSRKKLLNSLKLNFKVLPHRVDEEKYKNRISNIPLLCQTLAQEKALSIQQKNSYVIGVDQMVSLNNTAFGKPKTKTKAVEILSTLQGKTHELISALYLQKPDGSCFKNLTINRLTMHPLTRPQIEFYLDQDQPYECAGSYKVESLGISLFSKIESPDFNSITGLPLTALCNELKPLQVTEFFQK